MSYAALFAGIGIGLARGDLGLWALLLGAGGAVMVLASTLFNLDLDRRQTPVEGEAVGYPSLAGFELEDGIYLIAPITWLGWLAPFFVVCAVGTLLYVAWVGLTVLRDRGAGPA